MPFKRNGQWYADVRWRLSNKSGRIKKKIGPRRKDAVEAEARIRTEMAAGMFDPSQSQAPPDPVLTLSAFADEQFLPWSEAQHSRGHHYRIQRIIANFLMPLWGDTPLDQIKTGDIEAYKAQRRGSRYKLKGWKKAGAVKASTVNRELACIKLLFSKACEWELIDDTPARKVKAFKETPNAPTLLEEDEILRLLVHAPDHLRALYGTAVYAGLRASELFRLEWNDVDLKKKVITVRPKGERTSTKSNKVRQIPIAPDLEVLLQQHPRQLGVRLVFPNASGHSYHTLKKGLATLAQSAGIEGKVGLHRMRHAFCSHAMMKGIPPRTVQLWMGHASLQTTLKYAHVSTSHQTETIGRLSYQRDDDQLGQHRF